MTLHQGLDLSRFKKVSAGKDTSTLRHSHGHEIKIAHKGLSPKMREALAALPVYLAEGGDPTADDEDEAEEPANMVEMASQNPPAAPVGEQKGGLESSVNYSPTEVAEASGESAPDDGGASEEDGAEAMPAAPGAPAAPEAAAPAAPESPPQKGPPLGKNEVYVPGSDADRQATLFAQSVANGKVQKKTIQQLFNDQSLPGKIGTIFGLLVSGAGAGLTHSPNAVMEMMNKEIEGDLESQKTSNSNAQNWYHMALQHELQKAQIPELRSRTDLNKAQTTATEMQAEIAAGNAAMTYMQLGLWGDLKQTLDKLPPGPLREKYAAAFGKLTADMQSGIQDRNKQTQQKIGVVGALTSQQAAQAPKDGEEYGKVNTKKIVQMKGLYDRRVLMKGPTADAAGNPIGLDPTMYKDAMGEANFVNKNRAVYNELKHSFEEIQDKSHLAETLKRLNFKNLDAYKAHIAGRLVTQGGMPKAEAEAMVDSYLPLPTDVGPTRHTKADQMWRQYKSNEEGQTGTIAPLGLVPTFPGPPKVAGEKNGKDAPKSDPARAAAPKQAPKAGGIPPDGTTGMSGKTPVVVRGGKWVPR